MERTKTNYKTQLSIVLVSWNSAQLVSLAVRSVHGQSYRQWELIAVDNGSNDDSRGILGPSKRAGDRTWQGGAGCGLLRRRAAGDDGPRAFLGLATVGTSSGRLAEHVHSIRNAGIDGNLKLAAVALAPQAARDETTATSRASLREAVVGAPRAFVVIEPRGSRKRLPVDRLRTDVALLTARKLC